jgi:aspartyl-tRNA(Asn)/glutamyl-tRNA(Gln) amidotransferase subunit B
VSAATDGFEMVVGLEVHVQLKTRTKAFCSCSTEYGALPNVNTCPVCLALPGTLPALNAQAVRLAVRTALALNCTVNPRSIFARKNYFYPDLPKGFQISQYDRPLAEKGRVVTWREDGSKFEVRITRVHMEEDAGKSIHDRYPDLTAIDLNRAGVPLIEIVSEPDIQSSVQAGEYLRDLKRLLEYIDVSDVNMEEGSLRVDANVSVRRVGDKALGTKVEVKNMNSIAGVQRACGMEFDRQRALLERGEPVAQQTLLWDGVKSELRPARMKEGSHDYRYFPEPDLPPLVLDSPFVASIRSELPELPRSKRERWVKEYEFKDEPPQYGGGVYGMGEFGRGASQIELLTASIQIADYYERVVAAQRAKDPKSAANWVILEILARSGGSKEPLSVVRVSADDLAALLDMVSEQTLSHSAAKRVFAVMAESGGAPLPIAEREGLIQERDSGALAQWVDEVLAENPAEAARFLGGEKKLQGVLVGLVMKKSKGRADPKQVNHLLASRTGA